MKLNVVSKTILYNLINFKKEKLNEIRKKIFHISNVGEIIVI